MLTDREKKIVMITIREFYPMIAPLTLQFITERGTIPRTGELLANAIANLLKLFDTNNFQLETELLPGSNADEPLRVIVETIDRHDARQYGCEGTKQ
jgi:hypothetical protein